MSPWCFWFHGTRNAARSPYQPLFQTGEEPYDWLSRQIDSFRFLEALASRGIAVKSQVHIVSGSVRYPVSLSPAASVWDLAVEQFQETFPLSALSLEMTRLLAKVFLNGYAYTSIEIRHSNFNKGMGHY